MDIHVDAWQWFTLKERRQSKIWESILSFSHSTHRDNDYLKAIWKCLLLNIFKSHLYSMYQSKDTRWLWHMNNQTGLFQGWFNTVSELKLSHILKLTSLVCCPVIQHAIFPLFGNTGIPTPTRLRSSYLPLWMYVPREAITEATRGQLCLLILYSNRKWLKAVSALCVCLPRSLQRASVSVYGGKVQTRLSLLPSESGNITEQPTDRRQSEMTLHEDIIMALHTGDTSFYSGGWG